MATQSLPIDLTTVDTSRYECVDGQLIERPVPILEHGKLQRRIANLLSIALEGLDFDTEAEISLNHWDELRSDWLTPDILVSAAGGFRQASNRHVLPPSLLAVEVLSPGQTFSNIRRKVALLISWGVAQVWLVDGDSQSIAMFPSSDTTKSEVFYEGSIDIIGTSVSVPLASIFL